MCATKEEEGEKPIFYFPPIFGFSDFGYPRERGEEEGEKEEEEEGEGARQRFFAIAVSKKKGKEREAAQLNGRERERERKEEEVGMHSELRTYHQRNGCTDFFFLRRGGEGTMHFAKSRVL